MANIRTEKVVDILTGENRWKAETLHRQIKSAMADYGRRDQWGDPIPEAVPRYDRESAVALYNQLKEYTASRGWFADKTLRPWDYDEDVFGKLDRSQPWWGFEFELGFVSEQQRREVINHVWDTWDGVTFDSEGEGDWASEITFVPTEQSTYYDGTAPALQFMQYIAENDIGYKEGGHSNVGTHLNLSLPDTQGYKNMLVTTALNNSVAFLPQQVEGVNVRNEMFGRDSLYGGFYHHGNYIEGKLFRSTYDIDQFVKYIRVSEVITKAAMAIKAMLDGMNIPERGMVFGIHQNGYSTSNTELMLVTNLWEMFTGEEEEPTIKVVSPTGGYTQVRGGDVNVGVCVHRRSRGYDDRTWSQNITKENFDQYLTEVVPQVEQQQAA